MQVRTLVKKIPAVEIEVGTLWNFTAVIKPEKDYFPIMQLMGRSYTIVDRLSHFQTSDVRPLPDVDAATKFLNEWIAVNCNMDALMQTLETNPNLFQPFDVDFSLTQNENTSFVDYYVVAVWIEK